MDKSLVIAVAGLLITVMVGFWRTTRALSRIELKVELMWDAFQASQPSARPGGRRRFDPPREHRPGPRAGYDDN
jgi:hypothetical protein